MVIEIQTAKIAEWKMLLFDYARGKREPFLQRVDDDLKIDKANGDIPIVLASLKGDIQIVDYLLSKGANVNAVDQHNRSPLTFAVSHGNRSLVKLLLEHGAKVSSQDHAGNCPFGLACEQGFTGIAELLISHGANVNSQDDNGMTPLILSCLFCHSRTAKMLISKGALLNIQDKNGQTCLAQPCIDGDLELVELLISHGADLNLKDKDGNTPLMFALSNQRINVVKMIAQHLITELHKTFSNSSISTFRQKVLNAIDQPIEFVTKEGHIEVFKLIDSNQLKSDLFEELKTNKVLFYFQSPEFQERLAEDVLNNLKAAKENLWICRVKVEENFPHVKPSRMCVNTEIDDDLSFAKLSLMFQDLNLIEYINQKDSEEEKVHRAIVVMNRLDEFSRVIDGHLDLANRLFTLATSQNTLNFFAKN